MQLKKKQMKKIITLALSLFILSSCWAQTGTRLVQAKEGRRLDSLLTPYVIELRKHTNNTAGMAIGVTKGEDVIYAKTFGYADVEKSLEADIMTVFHIASVSKPFTAAAIVKLVEEGKLKLDDPILDYIPDFEMKGEEFRNITIRHILTHTSGIPRHISIGDWENPIYGFHALEKNLEDAKTFDLYFTPGTEYNYSNSAFDILGVLISRVSGMSFEEYVKQFILIPSGMPNSSYSKPKDKVPAHWAIPHSYGLETQEWFPYPYSENYFPSSGLQTSLLDMCNWGILHVNKGSLKGREVIKEEYFSLLTQPYFNTPWGDEIGLSWFLQSYLDRPIYMHQGNDTGFESIMYVFPKDSISIVIMANRDFARTGRIVNAVSEILFEQEPKEFKVSAKYIFTDTYNQYGIEAAAELWNQLKKDSTDLYLVDDEDLLTTGAVLENAKNGKAAKEILEFYIRLEGQSTYAWRLLGNAHLILGDKEAAKACYEQTLKINPNYEKGKEALENLHKMKN